MRRRSVLLLVAAVAAAVAGLLLWLPFDPFEEPAGPIDTCVPPDVDAAWRFDGPALLRSPFVRAAWDRAEVVALREEADFEGRVLRPLRRLELAFATASLGFADPPGLERDLIPAEVVVATRGRDVLVASRISSRARAIEFVRRLSDAQLRHLGLEVSETSVVLRQEGAPEIHFVRHRDVLLVSTSAALLSDAAATASVGGGGLSEEPDAREALGIGRPAGPRILGWVRPRVAAASTSPAEGAPPPWAAALRAPGTRPVRVEVRLDREDALDADVVLGWDGPLPAPVAPFAAGAGGPASALAAAVARSAPPDETIVAGGIAVRAEDVLRALLGSQPPERQEAFEHALAAAGESVDGIAAALARHVHDGAGFVVARLREADQVLGGDDAGSVHAIPATLVLLRLRGAAAGDALVSDLRTRAETLFGAPLGDRVEVLADGTRLHTLERHGLAGQWELLQPAFAVRGETLLFSTHEGFLRRALAPREPAPGTDLPPGGAFDARIVAAPLRRWLEDQGWEHADRVTWRDWAEERRKLEARVPEDLGLRPEDRPAWVDGGIREMRRVRRQREIPEAAAAWRARWEWLGRIGEVRVTAEAAAGGGVVRVRIVPAAE